MLLIRVRGDYKISRERDYPALVKELRRQLVLSQEDLARKLGVSYTTINPWGNDNHNLQEWPRPCLTHFAKR